jgi:hypothetical protein
MKTGARHFRVRCEHNLLNPSRSPIFHHRKHLIENAFQPIPARSRGDIPDMDVSKFLGLGTWSFSGTCPSSPRFDAVAPNLKAKAKNLGFGTFDRSRPPVIRHLAKISQDVARVTSHALRNAPRTTPPPFRPIPPYSTGSMPPQFMLLISQNYDFPVQSFLF